MTYSIDPVRIFRVRPALPSLRVPKLGFGCHLDAICRAIMNANTMAYVAPFTGKAPMPSNDTEEDLGGRQPNW